MLTHWIIVVVTVDCSGVVDLAFVLHSAGTVHPERWHYITQFVADVVKRLDVGPDRTRVAVITYSSAAHVAFTLDQFPARQDAVQVIITRYVYLLQLNVLQRQKFYHHTIASLVKVNQSAQRAMFNTLYLASRQHAIFKEH